MNKIYHVQHQPEKETFWINLGDGLNGDNAAFMRYHRARYEVDGESIDFYKTFVPHEYRGKGLAAQLTRFAINWAEKNNFSISASCWYVSKFLDSQKTSGEQQ